MKDEQLTYNSKRFSERALDVTAFFLADVADGLGPFLVIDLTTRRDWTSTDAGTAMSMLLLGTVLSQTFTGAWIDKTHYKRLAVSLAAIAVALASVCVYFTTDRNTVFGLQVLTGVAVTIFPPALAAISLGMVGRDRLAARAGRNEACFHAGNVTAAGIAIGASWMLGTVGIFYGVAAMAIASAIVAQCIRERDIDHQLARGADSDDDDEAHIVSKWELLRDKRILWFAASVVLFHFANAAMLPLVGQKVGHATPDSAQAIMAICIIVAQITMVPVAIVASRAAKFGRRPIFLFAFAVLPIRGMLYTLTDSSTLLIANQVLDGVAAGIFGVAALLVMADLTRGTGRFNFAQGFVATAIGLGAAASQYVTGRIVDAAGYNAGFVFLSAVAVAALVLFALCVPETASASSRDSSTINNPLSA